MRKRTGIFRVFYRTGDFPCFCRFLSAQVIFRVFVRTSRKNSLGESSAKLKARRSSKLGAQVAFYSSSSSRMSSRTPETPNMRHSTTRSSWERRLALYSFHSYTPLLIFLIRFIDPEINCTLLLFYVF